MSRGKLIDSPEKFLNVVQKSQLLAGDDLSEFASGDEQSRDPVTIARTLIKQGKLTKWQASQLLSGYFQLMFGKYKLCDQIGKGELGSVYLAENAKLGRKVALKALSRKHTANPELVKRFLDEARAAAALDHRNIIHVHDVTSEGERHYVVMEYVAGQVLQQKVEADGPLPIDVAVACVRQAAEGMQYAHAQQVLHRDLKPANLMVDAQGTVKIMDVGVGQLRESKGDPSAGTGEMMLAATDYQSPEQIRGGEVTARSDIYALGGVLYFLLSGRAPFATKTEQERERIKTTKQPVPLTEIVPSVPQRLSDLCQKLMESAPENRPQSMAEVITALDGLQSAEDSAADMDLKTEPTTEEPMAFPAIDTGARPKTGSEKAASDQLEAQADESAVKAEEPVSAGASLSSSDFQGINIDLGKPAPSASIGPMDFAVDTKRRKKSKAAPPPKPAPTEVKAAAAVATDSAVEPAKPTEGAGGKRRVPLMLIIGGVCAALVLVLTGVGLAVLFMSSGKEPQVAKAADANAAAPGAANAEADGAAAEATPATSETVQEPSSDNTSTPAPATSEPTTPATAANNAAATPSPVDASTPAAAPAEVVPGPTVPAPGNAAVSPAPTPAAPETPAPTTPVPSPPAEPDKKAETPPPAKAEPKPEPKKEEPKTDQPPTFVFEPAVDLPPVAAEAPETLLGKVNIGPQDVVFINLVGGDTASKGKVSFTLQNAKSGVAPRDWEFFLDSGNGEPVVVATMSMPETELKFKWAAASAGAATATNLRNCSLKISAGQGKPQELALRKPQGIAPVSVVVDKKTSVKWVLEGAPDPDSLRLEIVVTGFKVSVPPTTIELGKKNKGEIFFGENREQAALMLKAEASYAGRNVEVTFDPHFLVPVEKDPVRLNKASRAKYENEGVALQRAQAEAYIIRYDKFPADQKAKEQNNYLQAQQLIEAIDKTTARMQQLATDEATIKSGGVTLECRVYSDSIEKQIDLLVNDPNAAPAEQ